MDTKDQVEGTKTEEPASSYESQDAPSKNEGDSPEQVKEIKYLPSTPAEDRVPEITPEKPTFMRVARKHISAEILTKYSIPYVDDPDPTFLLITQWLPEARLEKFWMESSMQFKASKSFTRPPDLLPSIIESGSPLETSPRTPPISPIHDSPSHDETSRQKSVEIVNRYSSPSLSRDANIQISPRQRGKEREIGYGAENNDAWEDIDNEKNHVHSSKGRKSNKFFRSVGYSEKDKQLGRKLKKLAWEKRIQNDGIFKSFSQLQVLLLFHAQHELVLELAGFDSDEKSSRENISAQLHRYIRLLQDYKWTQSLEPVPRQQSDSHLKEISTAILDFESAYRNPYASDNSLVNIGRRSTIDPVRRLLTRLLPRNLAIDNPVQAELLTHMRNLDFTESEMPLRLMSANPWVSNAARLLLALSGGLFLLIPMLIMNFVSSQDMRLLISSLSVILFSAFLSSLAKASGLDIFGGSAAYTAVLMIFVGKSGAVG